MSVAFSVTVKTILIYLQKGGESAKEAEYAKGLSDLTIDNRRGEALEKGVRGSRIFQ